MSINPVSTSNASSYISVTSQSKASNDSWNDHLELERREEITNRNRLGLDQLEANSSATRARIQSTEASAVGESSQSADIDYHWQTFIGKSYPVSEAPDYSTWDKEDAYCDILKRYNMMNLLSPQKAKELGLGGAYVQMKNEMNNVLYGANPFANGVPSAEMRALDTDLPQRMNRKVFCEMYGVTSDAEYAQRIKKEVASMYDADDFGAWGANSGAAQIYTKLSEFDLTENKKNLTGTMSRRALAPPLSFSPYFGKDANDVDVLEYYDYMEQYILKQIESAGAPQEQYSTYKSWTTLMREMYDLCRAESKR